MKEEIFYTNKDVEDTKIALLSDIHYYYPGYDDRIFYKIIRTIKEQNPNYICIVGDILDDASVDNLNALENFLKELSRIAPIVMVLGNHDEKTGYMWNWKYRSNNQLKTILKHVNNLHILNDSNWQDKDSNINFFGFNLSYHHFEEVDEEYKSFEEEVRELNFDMPTEPYNVVLFHSPINIYNFIRNHPRHNLNKANLILSGHMHNGCLPSWIARFINKTFKSSRGLISPMKKPFPKYAQGRIYNEKVDGYVYEGVTKLSHSTRMFHIFNGIYKMKVQFITIKKNNQE